MKTLLFSTFLCITIALQAQVPLVDYSFLAVPPSSFVNKVIVQPDGKILLGGGFLNYAGSGKRYLVRLNSDGSIDNTFNPGGTGPDHLVQDMDLMADGRILIAGNFVSYDGIPTQFVARLFPNGILDYSFQVPPETLNGAVLAVAAHRENTVLVGGEFFTCGYTQPHIARFTPTGAVDTTFQVGSGFTGNVHDLLVLPDARILVGGDFYMYQNELCGRIALLTSNGLYDPSMNNDPGFTGSACSIRALALQPDGKILAGGVFSHHNGVPRTAIARLDMNGAYDASFTSPFYPYALIKAIAVQADGHILAGGDFTSGMYDPNVPGPASFLRLNTDGSRDASYDVGEGTGPVAASVRSIVIQQDNKVLVGGAFSSFNTETQYPAIIRLHDSMITGITEGYATPAELNAWWSSGELRVTVPVDFTGNARLNVYTSTGQLVHSQRAGAAAGNSFSVPMDGVGGLLLVSLEQGNARLTAKVMVP